MNYPIWDLPAPGLLIAVVAIVHVFISHFAVGGGLFLVLLERRARRTHDAALLEYARRHSRFFVLLTLVAGVVTGVGIWFTIGLVHPSATSSLIQLFVWFWAIEWTFFATEIAAALVYLYGWDRLDARTHLAVGWVYAFSAWMSLVVINGILTFMLTPGAWPVTGDIRDAFFNPTYWPALVTRTLAAVGLAGLYALLTASWMADGDVKPRLTRFAVAWVLPMAVAIPLSLLWYVGAAAAAGVDVAGALGAAEPGVAGVLRAVVSGSDSGYPLGRMAAFACLAAGLVLTLWTVVGVLPRTRSFGPMTVAPMMLCGLLTFGGAEFVREDLRKPYVIGQVMFVNGLRLPIPWAASTQSGRPGPLNDDVFTVERVNAAGVLGTAKYVAPDPHALASADALAQQEARGRAVFRLLCSMCHTLDGHIGIRTLVAGRPVATLEHVIARLAVPVDAAGQPLPWSSPGARVITWRGRHMPPFAGTEQERHDLAVYLARLGGSTPEQLRQQAAGDEGTRLFDENCAMCHGGDGQWPMPRTANRSPGDYYDLLGRLPQVNEMMPPFPGTDEQRRAVAAHLAQLPSKEAR